MPAQVYDSHNKMRQLLDILAKFYNFMFSFKFLDGMFKKKSQFFKKLHT